jgi:hypothetical protein
MELRRGEQKTSKKPLVHWVNHGPSVARKAPSNILTLRVNGCSSKIYPIAEEEHFYQIMLGTVPSSAIQHPLQTPSWYSYYNQERILKDAAEESDK